MFEIFFKQIGYVIKFWMSTQKRHTVLILISITQYHNIKVALIVPKSVTITF